MTPAPVVVVGASGLIGRHVTEVLRESRRVFGLARRPLERCGLAPHPNLSWCQADITEERQVATAFQEIARAGGAAVVVHLASQPELTGDDGQGCWRVNVLGLRNVLDSCVRTHVRHVVLASSLRGCCGAAGGTVDETSPVDGDDVHAQTRRAAEEMLAEYATYFRGVVVRVAESFSDWCEYPPLYVALERWLSESWTRRLIAGRGDSAMPYLHAGDVAVCFERVLDRLGALGQGEVLLASADGGVAERDLFDAATLSYRGFRDEPLFVPGWVLRRCVALRDLVAREGPLHRRRAAPRRPGRPLRVDASRTRARIDWSPRPRLAILRRLPFLLENLKTDPAEWHRRNDQALDGPTHPTRLTVQWLLQVHEDEIIREYHALITGPEGRRRFAHYQDFTDDQHEWHHRVVLRHLINAVRTHERGIFMAYCRDLARRRLAQGFEATELCAALETLNLVCYRVLRRDPASEGLRREMADTITATLRAGCDQAQDVFELSRAGRCGAGVPSPTA